MVDISSLAADTPVLQSLLRISQAVLGAKFFDEALEVIAEQSLIALRAASASISRWDRQNNVLRTLINVGDLGSGEGRWPEDETYPITENLLHLLQDSRPYLNSIEDPDADPAALALLQKLNKQSELAVAVMYEDEIWGELWVSGDGGRRFGLDDAQLLQAIAAHTAVAIGRSELLSTVWRYSYEDPLTGLSNRRKLDEHLGQLSCEADHPVVMVCDLDGFKAVNDREGHPAGDALLRTVAEVLIQTASSERGSLVARLGGDEFCVILRNSTVGEAEQFALQVGRRMAETLDPEISLSWGTAEATPETGSPYDLMHAADMALLESKTYGAGRFSVGVSGQPMPPMVSRRGYGPRENGGRPLDGLVPAIVGLVDSNEPESTAAALELLGAALCNLVGAAGWSISVTTDDGMSFRCLRGIDSELDETSGLRVLSAAKDTRYLLADFPATERCIAEARAFVAARNVEDSDPAEIALLRETGYHGVLGVGVADAQKRYLLKVHSDSGELELGELTPYVKVLAHYCAVGHAWLP
jgi:diguanylate cyclase (GGDEF)-like protein